MGHFAALAHKDVTRMSSSTLSDARAQMDFCTCASMRRKGDWLSPIGLKSFVCALSGARYTLPKLENCSSAETRGNAPFRIARKLFNAFSLFQPSRL